MRLRDTVDSCGNYAAFLPKLRIPESAAALQIVCMTRPQPANPMFDGAMAQRGYALNRMCYSFNDASNRAAFVADEDGYCARYGLNVAQRTAVRQRNVLALLLAGGNIYYLAKLAGLLGLSVQDIGAQQTGMTVEAFRERLRRAGE